MRTFLILMFSWIVHAGGGPMQPEPALILNGTRLAQQVDTLTVDVKRSVVKWRGTKFWGRRKHEGVVNILQGEIALSKGAIVAGWFEIDMTTIEVTDIPVTDPVPRKGLRDHLMNADFFDVDLYPQSRFEISHVDWVDAEKAMVTGDLTIKRTTHPITFEVDVTDQDANHFKASAQFSINRYVWDVSFKGSRLRNDLVDDDIHFEVLLVAAK